MSLTPGTPVITRWDDVPDFAAIIIDVDSFIDGEAASYNVLTPSGRETIEDDQIVRAGNSVWLSIHERFKP